MVKMTACSYTVACVYSCSSKYKSTRFQSGLWFGLFVTIVVVTVCDALAFVPRSTRATQPTTTTIFFLHGHPSGRRSRSQYLALSGWVQKDNGEWEWAEDDPSYVPFGTATLIDDDDDDDLNDQRNPDDVVLPGASATPQLPSGIYRPKQSLGQNYLKDPNTVAKIIRLFHQDATAAIQEFEQHRHETTSQTVCSPSLSHIVELGPGAGAITDKLVETYGARSLKCIEIDPRSVDLLRNKHGEELTVMHEDVLQVDYAKLATTAAFDDPVSYEGHDYASPELRRPLIVVGNLPYYITSQILFCLADASHQGAVASATVTMQWEVAQRIVASTSTKDYGILSVVFQLYCSPNVKCHCKIPPTVFYPKPKVDSALVGLRFVQPNVLHRRLAGVQPIHLRRVLNTAFQQRRKTLRNSLRKLLPKKKEQGARSSEEETEGFLPLPPSVIKAQEDGDPICLAQALPRDWGSRRPEQLTPGQFVELTRLIFGPHEDSSAGEAESLESASLLGTKVWRKLKHGKNA